MALRNQPYMPLYIQDFLTDEKLMDCSAQATGVYIRLMCLMHKSEDYGKILLKQFDKQSSKQIENFATRLARSMPYPKEVILAGLEELINHKVLQIKGDFLVQKRMVKDNEISLKRAVSGSKGGKIAQAKTQATTKANGKATTEDEVEYESESENSNNKGVPNVNEIATYLKANANKLHRYPEPVAERADKIASAFHALLESRLAEENPIDEWRPYLRVWLSNQPLDHFSPKVGDEGYVNPMANFFKT